MTAQEHTDRYVTHLSIRQPADYPHGPIRINSKPEDENWWDITIALTVCDGVPLNGVIEEIRKSA